MRLRIEVTNSETLNSETFFSSAPCKVASFPLVLDLMHECYVTTFPDVFHWIVILFFTLRTRENNEKLKLDVLICSNRKKVNFCVQYFVF